MSVINPLSPMTTYYLRKFIEDRQHILCDLLPDITGEITLEKLLEGMQQRGESLEQQVNEIELLVDIHKKVSRNASSSSVEVESLEQSLLSCFGVSGQLPQDDKKIDAVRDCVDKLNLLIISAQSLLGTKISMKYLLESRPQEAWLEKFEITPKKKVTYNGSLNDKLNLEQVSSFDSWISRFLERCNHVMPNFNPDNISGQNEALFDDF